MNRSGRIRGGHQKLVSLLPTSGGVVQCTMCKDKNNDNDNDKARYKIVCCQQLQMVESTMYIVHCAETNTKTKTTVLRGSAGWNLVLLGSIERNWLIHDTIGSVEGSTG